MTFTVFTSGTLAKSSEVNANFSEVVYATLYNRMEQDKTPNVYRYWVCCGSGCVGYFDDLIFSPTQTNSPILSDTFSNYNYSIMTATCRYICTDNTSSVTGRFGRVENYSSYISYIDKYKSDYTCINLIGCRCETTDANTIEFCNDNVSMCIPRHYAGLRCGCLFMDVSCNYDVVCIKGNLNKCFYNGGNCVSTYNRIYNFNVGDCCTVHTIPHPCCSYNCTIPVDYKLVKNNNLNYDLYCNGVCVSEICGATVPFNYSMSAQCVNNYISDNAISCLCVYALQKIDKFGLLNNAVFNQTASGCYHCIINCSCRTITDNRISVNTQGSNYQSNCSCIVATTDGAVGYSLFSNYPEQVCVNVTAQSCKNSSGVAYTAATFYIRGGSCGFSTTACKYCNETGLSCTNNIYIFNKVNGTCYCACVNGTPTSLFDASVCNRTCACVYTSVTNQSVYICSAIDISVCRDRLEPVMTTCIKDYGAPKNSFMFVYDEPVYDCTHSATADVYDCNGCLIICNAAANKFYTSTTPVTSAYAVIKFCNTGANPIKIDRFATIMV